MSSSRRRVVASKPTRYGCRTCRYVRRLRRRSWPSPRVDASGFGPLTARLLSIRRVKCDEARPSCLKCTSTGRACDGYEISRAASHSDAAAKHLQPARSTSQDLLPRTRAPRPNASAVAALDEAERLAFDYFLRKTVDIIRQLSPDKSWIQLALQLSGDTAPVTFAITALGSASRAQLGITHTTLVQPKATGHHDLSIRQYGKAVASLQRYIDQAIAHAAPVEPVLLACLLLACLEVVQGRGEEAASHLRSGRRVAHEHTRLLARPATDRKCMLGVHSPEVTNQLLGSFYNLEQIFFQQAEKDTSDLGHESARSSPPYALVGALHAFASVEEANQHLRALIDASQQARDSLLRTAEAYMSASCSSSLDFSTRYCLAHCLARAVNVESEPQLESQIEMLAKAHEAWGKAFDDLETAHPQLQWRSSVMAMRLQHYFSYFTISTCRETEERAGERFSLEHARALWIAERYLSEVGRLPETNTGRQTPSGPERHRTFSLQLSILPALNLLCSKCRQSATRARAVSLLRNANRREGMFWSGDMAAHAEALQRIEEQRARELLPFDAASSLDNSVVLPEAARFSEVVLSPDRQGRAGSLRIICGRFLHEGDRRIELLEYRGSGYPIAIEWKSQVAVPY